MAETRSRPMTTRREFVATAAAAFATRYTRWLPRGDHLPLGFSTLGCPAWTWPQILDFAAAHGYVAVELRGLQATMDLSQAPELAPGDYAQPKGVTVLLESHGDFTDSPSLLELLRQADSPAVQLLWDAHHTFVSGKEQPEDTVRQLGRYIRHTHLKDSVPAATTGGRRYVLTGTGEVPVRRQIEALVKIGYRGFYSFEWEKRWHPDIAEPEVAIAQFATVAAEYLHGAGVR